MCPGWENPGRAPGGWDMGSPERAAPSSASLQGSDSSLPPSWEGQQECVALQSTRALVPS